MDTVDFKPHKTARRNSRNKTVTPREFVAVWQTSSSTAEVSSKLGISPGSVLARAGSYRKNGVMLKKYRSLTQRIDWDDLKEYAASFPVEDEE